jgi:histidinol phosphatase-like PHP family hydrolase
MAARKGVFLEITSRKGHSLTNGHVARMAQAAGAQLVLNSDSHGPEDIVALAQRERVVRGAGLDMEMLQQMDEKAIHLFEQLAAGL